MRTIVVLLFCPLFCRHFGLFWAPGAQIHYKTDGQRSPDTNFVQLKFTFVQFRLEIIIENPDELIWMYPFS